MIKRNSTSGKQEYLPEWSEISNPSFRYRRNKSNGTRNDARYERSIQLPVVDYISIIKYFPVDVHTNRASSVAVSIVFQPAFSPSAQALPSSVVSIPCPYVHSGCGGSVCLNPVVFGTNGGKFEEAMSKVTRKARPTCYDGYSEDSVL